MNGTLYQRTTIRWSYSSRRSTPLQQRMLQQCTKWYYACLTSDKHTLFEPSCWNLKVHFPTFMYEKHRFVLNRHWSFSSLAKMDSLQLLRAGAVCAAPPEELPQRHEREPMDDKETNKAPQCGHNSSAKRRRNRLKQPLTKDLPRVLSELLIEPKIALLHRVVKIVGPQLSWQLLRETLRLDKIASGQSVDVATSDRPELVFVRDEVSRDCKVRRRTAGGVFFTLLKEKVPRETYRTIYEVEDRKKKEAKKRARYRHRQRMDKKVAALRFDDLTLAAQSENFGAARVDVAPTCGTSPADAAMPEDGEVVEWMDVNAEPAALAM